jgi:hypothetical protein
MPKKPSATEDIKPEEYDYSHTCRTCRNSKTIHNILHCGCDVPSRVLSNRDIFTAQQCKNRDGRRRDD